MKERIIKNILNKMENILTSEQLKLLNTAIYSELINYNVQEKQYDIVKIKDDWKIDLRDFLLQKKIEGKADSTIKQYNLSLVKVQKKELFI